MELDVGSPQHPVLAVDWLVVPQHPLVAWESEAMTDWLVVGSPQHPVLEDWLVVPQHPLCWTGKVETVGRPC